MMYLSGGILGKKVMIVLVLVKIFQIFFFVTVFGEIL